MTGDELQQVLEALLLGLAKGRGVGVDFMEPLVLMAKLRVQKTPEKDDIYCWGRTPLLRVRRERASEGWTWFFYRPEGDLLGAYKQDPPPGKR